MNQSYNNASASSSSSLNSSTQDTEDDHTIASLLAEDEKQRTDGKLGKRLSHLDSIPVCCSFYPLICCSLSKCESLFPCLNYHTHGNLENWWPPSRLVCLCVHTHTHTHACMSLWIFAWRNLYDSTITVERVWFWCGLNLGVFIWSLLTQENNTR